MIRLTPAGVHATIVVVTQPASDGRVRYASRGAIHYDGQNMRGEIRRVVHMLSAKVRAAIAEYEKEIKG